MPRWPLTVVTNFINFAAATVVSVETSSSVVLELDSFMTKVLVTHD